MSTFGETACQQRGVVIGYDGRHNSKGFAHISAAVYKKRGIKCLLFEDYVATPLVPYTTVKYNCLAGIMVTASHNPKQDNGYKVYWTNGAQITEPHDKNIRSCIWKSLPPLDIGSLYDFSKHLLKTPVPPLRQEVIDSYVAEAIKQIAFNSAVENAKARPIVYTAMHGVGYLFAQRLFKALGLPDPLPVVEQVQPDPDFPTVVYPNPEEGEGALVLRP